MAPRTLQPRCWTTCSVAAFRRSAPCLRPMLAFPPDLYITCVLFCVPFLAFLCGAVCESPRRQLSAATSCALLNPCPLCFPLLLCAHILQFTPCLRCDVNGKTTLALANGEPGPHSQTVLRLHEEIGPRADGDHRGITGRHEIVHHDACGIRPRASSSVDVCGSHDQRGFMRTTSQTQHVLPYNQRATYGTICHRLARQAIRGCWARYCRCCQTTRRKTCPAPGRWCSSG